MPGEEELEESDKGMVLQLRATLPGNQAAITNNAQAIRVDGGQGETGDQERQGRKALDEEG